MTIAYIIIGIVALFIAFKVVGTIIAKTVFESPKDTAIRMRNEHAEYANPERAEKIVLNIII